MADQQRSEWQREYRGVLKHLHLCRDCKKMDAFTLSGKSRCAECTEKARIQRGKYMQNPENRAKSLTADRERRAERIENGCCAACGAPLYDSSYKLCPKCRAKCRARNARAARKRGVLPRTDGICWQCNRAPVALGRGLCASCYEKKVPISLKNIEKARENNPWRQFRYGKGTNKIEKSR